MSSMMVKRLSNILFIKVIFFFLVQNLHSSNTDKITILISLDGFRYDYLDRGLTPTLSSIANEGVRAAYLQPVFPTSTFPNHISIITGMYPTNHKIVANKFYDTTLKEYYQIGTDNSRNPKWYGGEPFWLTCKKNGVVAASYFWPSSDIEDSLRNPNYFETYEHKQDYLQRVNGVLRWLDLPKEKRPSFITLYFDSPDSYGHSFGTNSNELNKKISELDSVINQLVEGLKQRNIIHKTNLIIVSDHGMKDFLPNSIINIKKILPAKFADYINNSAYVFVQPKSGYEDSVVAYLNKSKQKFSWYLTDSLPQVFNIGTNSRMGKYFLLADCGYHFSEKDEESPNYVATHGYDNRCMEMQGIFVAMGPDFKKSYKSIGLLNVDIYPLLCKIFGFKINHKIDGDIKRIEHVLKD